MAEQRIGDYILQERLGEGGMGEVWKALDPFLNRLVAIKVMRGILEGDSASKERFYHEARIAAQLEHPNIVAVHRLGEDGGHPFIVMEFVPGDDLSALIKRKVFIPFDHKIAILTDLCLALSHAHQLEVVHRDVKPANVRIKEDGMVKVLDFGIAKIASLELTQTGAQVGSPYYMSPEQIRGRGQIDRRSDLWSVGVILYEFLTGHRPFEAEDLSAIQYQIVHEPHPDIREWLPGCRPELVQIVDRALSKEPDGRFASGEEFAEALNRFFDALPGFARDLRPQVEENLRALREVAGRARGLPAELVGEELAPVPDIEEAGEDYGALLAFNLEALSTAARLRALVEKWDPLLRRFEQARRQWMEGAFEECAANLEKILAEWPENAEAKRLLAECRSSIEQRRRHAELQRRVQSLLAAAEAAIREGKPGRALESLGEVLEMDPENEAALSLRREAEAAVERRRRLHELLRQAREHHSRGDFKACIGVCSEALSLTSDDPAFVDLLGSARESLQREERVADLLRQSRSLLEGGDAAGALELVSKARRLNPSDAAIGSVEAAARQALELSRRLDEFLDQARRADRSDDPETARRAALAGLELDPDHPELKTLRDRAEGRLAKDRRRSAALAAARRLLGEGNPEAALQRCESVLKEFPDDPEATKTAREAESSLRRLKELRTLLAEAQRQREQGDFEGCSRTCHRILEIDPRHSEALSLQAAARGELRVRQRVADLLLEARRHHKNREHGDCRDAALEGLRLDPEQAELKRLLAVSSQALEARKTLGDAVGRARRLLSEGRYEESLQSLGEARAAASPDVESTAEWDQADRLSQRVARIRDLMAKARQMREAGAAADCLQASLEALKLEPELAEARRLKGWAEGEAEKGRRVAALQLEARQASEAGDFASCLRAATEGLRLDPSHPGLEELRKKAVGEIETDRRVEELVSRGRQLLSRGDGAGAAEAARQALSGRPGFDPARRLAREAAALLESLGKAAKIAEQAASALRAGDYGKALDLASNALALDPRQTRAEETRREAAAALERLRREEEKREEIERLLGDSRRQREAGRPGKALRTLERLLRLEPDHAEGQALRSQTLADREVRRRRWIALAFRGGLAIVLAAVLWVGWTVLPSFPVSDQPEAEVETAETRAFREAEQAGSPQAWREFLSRHGSGPHGDAARKALAGLDQSAWAGAGDADDYQAYEIYLKDFPDGLHASEAKSRLEKFEEADTADATSWAQARSGGVDALRAHIREFGECVHAATASTLIQTAFYERMAERLGAADPGRAKEAAGQYLADYPEGPRAAEIGTVRNRIDALAGLGAAPAPSALRDLLASLPAGTVAAAFRRLVQERLDLLERGAWQAARSTDSPESYLKYLADFPEGPNAAEARQLAQRADPGTLTLKIVPWARVESVARDGKRVSEGCVAPCVLRIEDFRPGTYTVRLTNHLRGNQEEFRLEIPSGRTDFEWFHVLDGFDLESELGSILRRP